MSALSIIAKKNSQSVVHPLTGNVSWVKAVVRQVSFTLLLTQSRRNCNPAQYEKKPQVQTFGLGACPISTTIPCSLPPTGGKDTPALLRVGLATPCGRSAGRSNTSAAGLSEIYPMRKQRYEIIRRRPSSRSGCRT
ncbi:hypothetical protein DPMN_186862 [Dreissena polymorpha]|uniref:Uncharacterized protein n=1 Tax=Dreissena polymorpha TaxID=45954 RepID=A0A9D4I6X8_DREPO|nr:hypothetical protein DPMN_186862 [Dreissena polymorpha]